MYFLDQHFLQFANSIIFPFFFFAKYTFFIYSNLLQIASSSYIWIFVIDQIAYHKFVPCSIFFATDFLLFPWWSPSLQLAACSILTCTIQSNELKVYLLFCLWFNAVEEHTRSACFMMFTTALTLSIKILSQLAFFSAEGGRNHASESRTNKQVRKNNNFCLLLFEKSRKVHQRIYFSETSFTSFCTWKGIMAIDTGLRFHTKTIVFTSWFLSFQMIFYKLFSKTHWMHF